MLMERGRKEMRWQMIEIERRRSTIRTLMARLVRAEMLLRRDGVMEVRRGYRLYIGLVGRFEIAAPSAWGDQCI